MPEAARNLKASLPSHQLLILNVPLKTAAQSCEACSQLVMLATTVGFWMMSTQRPVSLVACRFR
ncbi:hypothetical protein GGD46_003041 [Rhizobium lusitanum]|uniref:Uncharacterized protein n=1 Tax=Rhizobium lusitanum TaxID=293958 RepID=A0A7X0ITM1_9HYPH|nr:hypothetical protein [Rhizobium lusitanum]